MSPLPIPRVVIPGTTLDCPRLIFGTASLFNVGRQSQRLGLLSAAVDAGFSHFDTAPYYGFGWAERDLGALARIRPEISITSKVGIYSPGGERGSYASVFARKAAGRLFPSISRPAIDFSIERAKRALEASLGRLGRSRIELYMLHEPQLEMLQADEWQKWLETETAGGRVGAFGLALTRERLLPFLEAARGLAPVIQMLDSLDVREADCLAEHGRPLQITYGYVSAALQRDPGRPVADVLGQAMVRNASGAIIVSTKRIDRLGQYGALLERAK